MSKLTAPTQPGTTLQDRLQKARSEGKDLPVFAGKPSAAPNSGTGATAPVLPKCLLLDCSASMAEDCEPGRSKHSALRQLIATFPLSPKFAFASSASRIVGLPSPSGTTNMTAGFEAIKRAGHRSAVLITDGEPDDEQSALTAAAGLSLDIFYVGAGPRPKFLDDLARRTGGTCGTANLAKPKELGAKIRGLITK